MPILFVNPHIHHSYFTLLALSQSGSVLLLCPPLHIDLYLKRWTKDGLNIYSPNAYVRLIQLISILSFLAFKWHLLSEECYVQILRSLSSHLIETQLISVFVHYQDYIGIKPRARSLIAYDICELIIRTSKELPNWKSSMEAVRIASHVVVPTSNLFPNYDAKNERFTLAPYGGNKDSYRKRGMHSSSEVSFPHNHSRRIIIAARANSYRKGLDILLKALRLLDQSLSQGNTPRVKLEVYICGAIQELMAKRNLIATKRHLKIHNLITVSARQYSQTDYIKRVRASDIFIMPSRLEGSSPAALEALWLGVPAILSQECGIDQFKDQKHGLLLETPTPEHLLKALVLITSHTEQIVQWKCNLVKDRDGFSWLRYLNAYKDILSGIPCELLQ